MLFLCCDKIFDSWYSSKKYHVQLNSLFRAYEFRTQDGIIAVCQLNVILKSWLADISVWQFILFDWGAINKNYLQTLDVYTTSIRYLYNGYCSYSAIDLVLTDPFLLPDFSWQFHDDLSGSDNFPIRILHVKRLEKPCKI